MTTSGEQDPGTATLAAPATPELPEGMVIVRQSEHDALQGDLRRTRKENATLKQADTDRQQKERTDAHAAAGDFDKAMGEERTARNAAESRASKAELGDAITDVLLTRSYTGEQARAIRQLVDRGAVEKDASGVPIAESVTAAVDAVVAQYPNLFSNTAPPPPDVPAQRAPRRPGPATPAPGAMDGKPEGYISQEDYANTPQVVRFTADFKKRVELSEPYWEKHIHRSDLQSDPS